MTQAKHTPGPWFSQKPYRSQENGYVFQCAVVRNGITVAYAIGGTEDEAAANANLIAAAPDLLEALRDLREAILRHTDGLPDWLSHQLDFTDNVIAKAMGEL